MLVHDEGVVQLGAQIGPDGLDVFLPQLVALAELGFGQTLGVCLSGKLVDSCDPFLCHSVSLNF